MGSCIYLVEFQIERKEKKKKVKKKKRNEIKNVLGLCKCSCDLFVFLFYFIFIIKQQLSQLKSKLMTFNDRFHSFIFSKFNISLNDLFCLQFSRFAPFLLFFDRTSVWRLKKFKFFFSWSKRFFMPDVIGVDFEWIERYDIDWKLLRIHRSFLRVIFLLLFEMILNVESCVSHPAWSFIWSIHA